MAQLPQPQQLGLHPGGPPWMSGPLGEGTQLGTAENGVLVLLSSNPGWMTTALSAPTPPW